MTYSSRKVLIPDVPGEHLETVTVGRHHLDSNGHVNNGQYIKIAMGSLTYPDNLTRLRAEYREQAHLGDEITPILYRTGSSMVIELTGRAGNTYTVIELKY